MQGNYPKTLDESEVDALFADAMRATDIVNSRLSELGVSISLDNFLGSAAGRWSIQVPKGWVLSLYNFSISLINLSHGSWIATRNATGRTSSSAESDFPWSIERDGTSDKLIVTVWGKTQIFENASSPDSPIAWEYNHDSKKFVFLARRDCPLDNFKILKGAYISASDV